MSSWIGQKPHVLAIHPTVYYNTYINIYVQVEVSTAVILKPTRIETSRRRFWPESPIANDVYNIDKNQHSQIGPTKSLWRCRARAQEQLTTTASTRPLAAGRMKAQCRELETSASYYFSVLLLVRCVHPWACDISRTWSTIARSVIVSSSSGCISAYL